MKQPTRGQRRFRKIVAQIQPASPGSAGGHFVTDERAVRVPVQTDGAGVGRHCSRADRRHRQRDRGGSAHLRRSVRKAEQQPVLSG